MRPVTQQSRVDDLTVKNFGDFQRKLLWDYFHDGPTLPEESIFFLLEIPTRLVTTKIVTEDPPPLTISFRFPAASAPVPVGLVARSPPVPSLAVALALALVMVLEPVEQKRAEPRSRWRPLTPKHVVRFSDSFQESLPTVTLQYTERLSGIPCRINPAEQKPPVETKHSDLQSLRHLPRKKLTTNFSTSVQSVRFK